MTKPVLSILIPTVPRRVRTFFPDLLTEIHRQIDATGAKVEVLGLYDNKYKSVGEKRNWLLDMAGAPFLTFVDDDDWIDLDFMSLIPPAVEANPDAHVIVYDQSVTIDDGVGKRCIYGVEYAYTDTPDLWTGLPAHTMTWRTEIARKERFPERNFEEDMAWVKRIVRHVDPAKQVRIPRVLYYYRHNQKITETR